MSKPPKKSLLLVEDQAVIALDESRRLKKHGFEVTVAYTGEDAVRRVEDGGSFDLILMDIDLGAGIDGTEAARRILRGRDLPVVFLTGHAEREMVDRVRGITRYGYVLKNSGDFVLISSIEMAFELFDAHQEAKEKQLLLERAEGIAHLGSWELNLYTGATYWSNEFFRICGLEPGAFEPSAERGIALIHPDDRDRAAQAVSLSVETGEPYDIVKRIVRPDGSVRTVQSVGEISYDQEGKPAKLSGSFLDITDLLATEGKYQTLFEASPVAMSEEDFSQVKAAIDGLPIAARENPRTFFADKPDLVRELAGLVRVVDVNRAAVRLYNASDKQQLLGTITKTYGEDSFDGLVEALVAIAEGRRALSVRTRHYTFDGKPLDLRLTWSVPEQHADTYSRVLVAASDISEISRECKKNSAAASAYSNTRLHP